jgi:uncharacterized membrane protein
LFPVAILFAVYATANTCTNLASSETFANSYPVLSVVLPLISFLLYLFACNPLLVGISFSFLKGNSQDADPKDFLKVFRIRYFRTVKNMLLVLLKILCWSLVLVVPGIVRLFQYALVPFVLAEHPEMDDEDAFEASKMLMQGNKWRFCKLILSFFGWLFLAACTFGVGILFLWPYLHGAYAQFYLAVKEEKEAK